GLCHGHFKEFLPASCRTEEIKDNGDHGWVSSETESLNPQHPGDLKEAFNTVSLQPDMKWPSDGLDGFREIKVDFFLCRKELSLRVLRVMALSLGLDSEVFLKAHCHIGSKLNTHTHFCVALCLENSDRPMLHVIVHLE
ncbi:hypothetical protein QTP70_015508, partial [Hemibagrus guttatus]